GGRIGERVLRTAIRSAMGCTIGRGGVAHVRRRTGVGRRIKREAMRINLPLVATLALPPGNASTPLRHLSRQRLVTVWLSLQRSCLGCDLALALPRQYRRGRSMVSPS